MNEKYRGIKIQSRQNNGNNVISRIKSRTRKSSCVNARGIPPAIAHSAVSWQGGTPIQSWWGRGGGSVPPSSSDPRAPSHPDLEPDLVRGDPRVPPLSWPGHGGYTGVPSIRTLWGYPPPHWQMGYPSPLRCELTNKLKTVPSPILRIRAVKI